MRAIFTLILLIFLSSCTFNKLFYRPDRLPDNMTVTIHNTDKADTMLLHFEGPGHTAIFTDTKNNPKQLDYSVKTVSIASTDGNKLYGWLLTPNNFQDPKITLLFLHGNAGNIVSQVGFALPLVKRGFQVLLVDYSGYGFSGGKATRKNMLADGNAALRFLHNMKEAQNTRLMIYGQSIGGHLTYPVAVENEQILDGIITEGAPSSHKDIAAYQSGMFGFLARILVREEYSAFRSVKEFHKPVLVIHSTEDETVPFALGEKIYRNANSPKSFYQIEYGHILGPLFYADSISYKIRAMAH